MVLKLYTGTMSKFRMLIRISLHENVERVCPGLHLQSVNIRSSSNLVDLSKSHRLREQSKPVQSFLSY